MRAGDNPFRTDRVLAVRYHFLDGSDMTTLLKRLEALDFRAAIVGPEGSGKTTLQEDMAEQLQAKGYTIHWLRLNRENRTSAPQLIEALFETAKKCDWLFVDGAEQIGRLRWRLFKSRADQYAGLVINTHLAGRLPTLINCRTSPELLQEIVRQLVPDECPSMDSLRKLIDQHDGNLRLCLRRLYDQWTRSSPVQSCEP